VGEDGVATVDGTPLTGPTNVDDLGRALVATGFGYDAEVRRHQGEIVARVLPEVRDVRRAGSAALDLAWLAAGRLDGYYEFGVKPWDIAAGELLCRAVGLEFQQLPGDGTLPPGVLAAPPAIAGRLRELVSPES
jgi:myo-inositol-1(or 4)-monophosphatase